MSEPRFYPLRPGATIPGDLSTREIPDNIEVGEGTVIDSAASFERYKATGPCGLRVGANTTISRTSLAAEETATIEIGEHCYLADAALACVERITIGNEVVIASGATIVDSDFHPFGYEDRIADAVALSPAGSWDDRPDIAARPVEIGDGVRIGFNATILKGVRIGNGAVVGPGAVVSADVAPGAYVIGNPAEEVER